MEVQLSRTLNDFKYLDYYWCDSEKGAPYIKATRCNYSEDYNEYLDINHIWRGKNLYDWIIQAYNAGKNGEELKFVVHKPQEASHHFYRFKTDEDGNILNEEGNIIGKYSESTYWGEVLPKINKYYQGKKEEQLKEEVFKKYCEENNIVFTEHKPIQLNNKDDEIPAVHYDIKQKDFNDININWDNVEFIE